MVEMIVIKASASDIEAVVVKALSVAPEPQSMAKLREGIPKLYRPSENDLAGMLEKLVADGLAWKYSPIRGKAPCYFCHPPDVFGQQVILEELTGAAHTLTSLERKVKSRLHDLPPSRRKELVIQLVGAGKVREWPLKPKSRVATYSTTVPDPHAYLETAIRNLKNAIATIAALLEPAGVSRKETNSAAQDLIEANFPVRSQPGSSDVESPFPPEQFDERILEQMVEIEPAAQTGALVSIPDLRRSLDFCHPDKEAFDNAILRLSRQGRIAIHRHDYPTSLPADERELLVFDGQSHFSGAALRQ